MRTGRRITIHGTVQGVGFRPWVYRLAHEEGLTGSVRNDSEGVTIEIFGPETSLERFVDHLAAAPPAARIDSIEAWPLAGESASLPETFRIVSSASATERRVSIPPDLATCDDCLAELFDPGDRRYLYPFINCTNCGPRFTITLDLPYDRPATTMAGFEMCGRCRGEYEDPLDRRFHAQPNACPECGPRVTLLDPSGTEVARDGEAMIAVAMAVRRGLVVAVKGLGGFHLVVSATDRRAVERLRRLKHRWEKPLAVMVENLAAAERLCRLGSSEIELLSSAAAPIVLARRRPDTTVVDAVAPENPRLGLMLPSTPLHHLLVRLVGCPIVATSGNLSDEPIATGNSEALERLGGIADLFLVHDRPIARHADDSVLVTMRGLSRPLRRARGYAPGPIRLTRALPTLLAVGGHMKNVVALSRGRDVVPSQHIGDMETPQAMAAFERVIVDLLRMLEAEPVAIVHDLHPDYPSSRWAAEVGGVRRGTRGALDRLIGLPLVAVQHHHAHLASCLLDNELGGEEALGITWDGTGYGPDGTVWGGEVLRGGVAGYRRLARLRPFRLPGGEAAVREPRRSAFSLLVETFGGSILDDPTLPVVARAGERFRRLVAKMVATGLGSPLTSSAGRLFDGFAALCGLCQQASFEGQAAMALELVADANERDAYPILLAESGEAAEPGLLERPDLVPHLEIDWRPTVAAAVEEIRRGVAPERVAARFHNALVAVIVELARTFDEPRVALTGGCFQNVLLTSRASEALEREGFEVLLHRRVPANDGGLALGQIAVAAARLEGRATTDVSSRNPRSKEVRRCV